jgi:hypothetical protein
MLNRDKPWRALTPGGLFARLRDEAAMGAVRY